MSKSTRQIPTISTPLPRGGSNMTIYSNRRNGSVESRNFSQLLELGKKYYRNNEMYKCTEILKRGLYYDPTNPEVNYLLGVAYLVQENDQEAIKYLQGVSKNNPDYNGEVMMLLAICHKRQGNLPQALEAISKQVQKHGDVDSLFLRAKINHQLQCYQQAIDDIDRLLLIKPQTMPAFMLKNKCLVGLKQEGQALQNIKVAKAIVAEGGHLQQLILEQAKIYVRMSDYQKALKILENIEKQFPQMSPEWILFKANLYQQTGRTQQSMMLYNELLGKNNSSHIFSQALAQSAISCMRQRDFYQSFSYLKRSNFMNVKSKATDQLLRLAEGVTFLMKKKYAQAIVLMGSCEINFIHELKLHMPFLKNLKCNALAFGNFSLGNHEIALELYGQIIQGQKSTDMTAVSYNIAICEGILAHQKGMKDNALEIFEKAAQAISRPEPYFYMAVLLNQDYLHEPINTDGFVKVLQLIEKGLRVGENAHMYYYRAILYLYLGMNNEALEDIDRAIQKSEDNVARYFHARGVIFFLDKNYDQAIMQFGTALSIDENDQATLIEKAKCELLQGEQESAYKTIEELDNNEQWVSLFLLYDRQYNRVLEGNPNESIKQICHFMEGRFEQAGPGGKLMLAILYENYEQVIGLIEQAVGLSVTIGCLESNDLLILKAFCQYRLQKFSESLQTLSTVQNILKETSSRNETYSQEDERKLLLCRVNIILINFRRQHQIQALTLAEELASEICEGPIFDEVSNLRNFLAQGGQLQLQLGFGNTMLSDYFAEEEQKGLIFKYFIPFPTYRVLEVEFPQYQQLLLNFTTKDIDNRPEAPWIKRGQYGLIFTNEVRQFENLNLKTEQNEGYRSRMPTNESRVMPHKRSQLIQNLKLSTSVLDKLQKLAQKNNKS